MNRLRQTCLAAVACLLTVAAIPAIAQTAPTKTPAAPADTVFMLPDSQASNEIGVTIIVKSITVGEDATVVNLVASFDSQTTSSVELNDVNASLVYGEGKRLHMRQPEGDTYLRIENGQSMAGDIVFPGRIPQGIETVTLLFNEGNAGDDIIAPGLTIDIPLTPAQ